jgi:hypothetical protein
MREPDHVSQQLVELDQACAQQEYVRIQRRIDDADDVTGFVVALGTHWVLLNVVSQGSPNGWVALPVADVEAVAHAAGGRFVRRGLESQSYRAAVAPEAALNLSGSVAALLVSAASSFPLVTFYTERRDPHSCVIGRPVRWGDDDFCWQELDENAVWRLLPTSWVADDVTRMDIGGQYETALSRVADLRGAPLRVDSHGQETEDKRMDW